MSFQTLINKAKENLWIFKAWATSMFSAIVDFTMSFLTFALLDVSGGVAAAVGAVSGGVANCTLNYRWTFCNSDSPLMCVVVKYAAVWVGSLLLNSFGTEFFTNILLDSEFLDALGMARNVRFTIARLAVSAAVSIFWNLLLQKWFVYRHVLADEYISRLFSPLSKQ